MAPRCNPQPHVTKARLGRVTIVEFSSGDETCFAPAHEGVPLGDLMTKKRKVKVDGEEFDVELEKVDGVWAVTVGSKKFTIEVSGGKDDREGARKRKRSGRSKHSGTISSTIPGKIVSIAVELGVSVSEGDVVMVLEAMKMQNEIHAPLSGIVSQINCQPGESVEANAPLIVIEPEEDKSE